MVGFSQSSVAMIQVNISKLGLTGKTVGVRVSVTDEDHDNVIRADDFLTKQYQTLSVDPEQQSYVGLPEVLTLNPGVQGMLPLTKGQGTQPLLVLFPNNQSGAHSQIVK